jgi:hypothetical protein
VGLQTGSAVSKNAATRAPNHTALQTRALYLKQSMHLIFHFSYLKKLHETAEFIFTTSLKKALRSA